MTSWLLFTLLTTVSGLHHPESVLLTPDSIYVSDLGADTGEIENGDGGLLRYDRFGNLDVSWGPRAPLHSPMAMALHGETLYTLDIDRLVGFSVLTGEQSFELKFTEGTKFLNDVDVIGEHKLLVTATDIRKLFVVDLEKGTYETLNVDLKGLAPNGVTFDRKRGVIFCAFNLEHKLGENGNGQVLVLKLSADQKRARVVKQVSLGRFLDGVEILNDRLLVSDWNGRGDDGVLFTLDPDSLELLGEQKLNIAGFADFDVDPVHGVLVAPDLVNGRFRIFSQE